MGDPGLIIISGEAPGPLHLENTTFRTGPNAIYFTGGGGTGQIDVRPSGIIRRCRWQIPQAWIPDQPFQGAWIVSIAANGRDVTYVSGHPWGDPTYSPRDNCIMYELATGIARRVTMGDVPVFNRNSIQLTTPWPSAPQTNITVSFQIVSPDIAASPLVYNSALKDEALATIGASSFHVTLSKELPQSVADEINAGHILYFYFNNTRWTSNDGGDSPGVPPFNQPSDDNGWGPWNGACTRAQCKRKRIDRVASNRLSLELVDTSPYYLPALTFSYSISRFDGLTRRGFIHNKGSFENKTTEGWLYEGNVIDHTGERMYATNQPGDHGYLGSCTIVGNSITFNAGTWPSTLYDSPRELYGAPYGFTNLFIASDGNFNEFQNATWGRNFLHRLSSTTGVLQPIDPNATKVIGNGTYNLAYMVEPTPWVTIKNIVFRYNIMHRGNATIINGTNSYCLKTIAGGQVSWHDNLYLRMGDLTLPKSYGVLFAGFYAPQAAGPLSPYASWYGPDAVAVYDTPPILATNNLWRYDHNTVVRTNSPKTYGIAVFGGLTESPISPLARDISIRNNLIVDLNSSGASPTAGLSQEPRGTTPINDTSLCWDPIAVAVEHNIFHGTAGIIGTFGSWDRAATNSCLAQIEGIGLPNYANGATDLYNLNNYALGDIYSTGTVQISSDGMTVTLETGDFPIYVNAGQFFKTSTNTALIKIASLPSTALGANWQNYAPNANVFVKRSGIAYSGGGIGPYITFQSHIQSLTGNQWAEVTVSALSPTESAGVGIRFAAPPTISGYIGDTYNGGTVLRIIRLDAFPAYAIPLITKASSVQPGDILRLTGNGTTLTLTVTRGGTVVDTLTAPADSTYSTGFAAMFQGNPAETMNHFAAFSCGNLGSGAAVTDNFSGGGSAFQLVSPGYPEKNVTGKSFVITFKNSGTDGTDPGADLATLDAMTIGVIDPVLEYQ